MCREAGRSVWVGPEEQRGPVELYVNDDRTWYCTGCDKQGDADTLLVIRRMLDAPPDPSRALCLASQLHHGTVSELGQPRHPPALKEFARLLLKRCADDPELALELLWPWARLHVQPPPTYYECEAVLDDLATRFLKAVP